MTDIEALHALVIYNSDNNHARLVYADKIQEHYDTEEARAHAEFIRLQVRDIPEAAACSVCSGTRKVKRGYCNAFMYGCDEFGDGDCTHKNELISCTDCPAWKLETRARIIWRDFLASEFRRQYGDHLFLIGEKPATLPDDTVIALIRRGFISEVRSPLTLLVGGECERCHGRGFLGHPAPGQHGYIGAPNCPVCHGTGRTLAVLPAIAKSHPLERVEVVDRRPWQNGYSRKFVWWRESAWSTPDFLFDIIASAHPENVSHHGGPPSHVHIAFDSEHDALAALSRALIIWARSVQAC